MAMERKAQRARLKAADDEGRATVRFATFGVVDSDGDILAPGSVGTQEVVISAYGHQTWGGQLPVGRGRTSERGDAAIADLQFNLEMESGREHFRALKGTGELQEWSFGFDVEDSGEPTDEQRRRGAQRILRRLRIHEVSPVLRGAGVGTRTLSLKCDSCAAKDTPEDPAILEAARHELQVAQELLGLRKAKARWYTRQPDQKADRLAFRAAQLGHALLDYFHRVETPAVKWYRPELRKDADGFVLDGEWAVHLASTLRSDPERLVRTVLHEMKHLAQPDHRGPGSETDAEAFARKWAGPVLAACKWATSSHPVIRDGRPPWPGEWRRGAVVLSTDERRAYLYRPRNRGNAWSPVS